MERSVAKIVMAVSEVMQSFCFLNSVSGNTLKSNYFCYFPKVGVHFLIPIPGIFCTNMFTSVLLAKAMLSTRMNISGAFTILSCCQG